LSKIAIFPYPFLHNPHGKTVANIFEIQIYEYFFRECALKIALTRSIFSPKCTNGFRSNPLEEFTSLPQTLAGLRGPTSKGRVRGGDRRGEKGEGGERKGRKGRGREREEGNGESEGKAGWCPHMTCLHDAPELVQSLENSNKITT